MSRHRMQVELSAKRIRAVLGGHFVLDTTMARLVWEIPYYPQYYVPLDDIAADLEPAGPFDDPPGDFGVAERYDVVTANGVVAKGGAWAYPEHPELAGLVRFDWASLDAWFEEDEVVHTHPRSPYVRIDALRSSRDVRIGIDGTEVARSVRPTLLFETHLQTRYYLPAPDVRLDLLRPSETTSHCPYKGEASYYSVKVDGRLHPDIAWYYTSPLAESAPIAGLICFFDEKVDVTVGGVDHDRPNTKFA